MFEVTNQFRKDPGLIRVRNATMHMLGNGGREHLGPRQMMARNLLQLALVDFDRMVPAELTNQLSAEGDWLAVHEVIHSDLVT